MWPNNESDQNIEENRIPLLKNSFSFFIWNIVWSYTKNVVVAGLIKNCESISIVFGHFLIVLKGPKALQQKLQELGRRAQCGITFWLFKMSISQIDKYSSNNSKTQCEKPMFWLKPIFYFRTGKYQLWSLFYLVDLIMRNKVQKLYRQT